MAQSIAEITEKVREVSSFTQLIKNEIAKHIVGQEYLIDRLLIGLLSDGHLLLEGVPGLEKTKAVKALAQAIHTSFKRIQFTPDLLPSDILGTEIYRQHSGEFEIKQGAVFANIVLADEINRAPSKVQSALLETMEERQVSIGGKTMHLPKPFLVLATENPIEQEGTYPLPEAQVDRFMMKLKVGYGTKEDEMKIIEMNLAPKEAIIQPVIDIPQLLRAKEVVSSLYIDEKIHRYIVDIVFATRNPHQYGLDNLAHLIEFGASPRASINLAKGARTQAFLNGRGYVTPQDVKSIGLDVLRHRILLSYEADAEGTTPEEVIEEVFSHIPIP